MHPSTLALVCGFALLGMGCEAKLPTKEHASAAPSVARTLTSKPASELATATGIPSAAASATAADTSDEGRSLTPDEMKDATRLLQTYIVESGAGKVQVDSVRSPERLAQGMVGRVPCGKRKCRAGKEVCVSSPSQDGKCQPIEEWLGHHTPVPRGGFPPLAGVMACLGSENCPPGSFCCLHEIGNADVQAAVCHADVAECRDKEELCSGNGSSCRTPSTRCDEYRCVPR